MSRGESERQLFGSGLYEYAFIPVPQQQRKNSTGLFYVLAGYTSALSCLVLGAKLGAAMPFWQAVGACFVGDVMLIMLGAGMGILSARSGWSTAFLAREELGQAASVIFSLLIITCSIFWIGFNGKCFSSMLIAVFPEWRLPESVTSLIVIALWAASASGGWRTLEMASRVVVPCSLVLLFYTMFLLAKQMDGAAFLNAAPVNAPVTFAAASTAVIGNFIFGCIITPDTCRFARSSRSVVAVCSSGYALGLFLFNVCGVVLAKAGGFDDVTRCASALSLLVPLLLCSIFCLGTTQNINIYGGSLALQNIFRGTALEGNVSHRVSVYLIAGFASAIAVSGVTASLLSMVSYFSILMVPLPAMLFCEALFFRGRKKTPGFQMRAAAVWGTGSFVGYILLHSGVAAVPFWELLWTGLLYIWSDRLRLLQKI
ncbi:MAG: cytosine permease [Cloacibacillus sp.]